MTMPTKKTVNKSAKTTKHIIEPLNKELAITLQKAMDRKGVTGLVETIREMRYMYESLWSEIRSIILARFSVQVQVRTERDGGHVFLHHVQPIDYLPTDHAAIMLDDLDYPGFDPEFKGWAICSGCGRPFRYTRTSQTVLVMTPCPNLRSGTGTTLIVEALSIPTIMLHS
jgi:hypothetical protein